MDDTGAAVAKGVGLLLSAALLIAVLVVDWAMDLPLWLSVVAFLPYLVVSLATRMFTRSGLEEILDSRDAAGQTAAVWHYVRCRTPRAVQEMLPPMEPLVLRQRLHARDPGYRYRNHPGLELADATCLDLALQVVAEFPEATEDVRARDHDAVVLSDGEFLRRVMPPHSVDRLALAIDLLPSPGTRRLHARASLDEEIAAIREALEELHEEYCTLLDGAGG